MGRGGKGVQRRRHDRLLGVVFVFNIIALTVFQHVLRGGKHVPIMQESVLSATDINERGLKGRLQILDSAFENRTDKLIAILSFHEKN